MQRGRGGRGRARGRGGRGRGRGGRGRGGRGAVPTQQHPQEQFQQPYHQPGQTGQARSMASISSRAFKDQRQGLEQVSVLATEENPEGWNGDIRGLGMGADMLGMETGAHVFPSQYAPNPALAHQLALRESPFAIPSRAGVGTTSNPGLRGRGAAPRGGRQALARERPLKPLKRDDQLEIVSADFTWLTL